MEQTIRGNLGANAMLGVSLACARAAAESLGLRIISIYWWSKC